MLNAVNVEGFRGIKTGTVEHLAQVNIITGRNNRGKSNFLQSLYLLNRDRDKMAMPFTDEREMFWGYEPRDILYEITNDEKKYRLLYYHEEKQIYCYSWDFIDIYSLAQDGLFDMMKNGHYEYVTSNGVGHVSLLNPRTGHRKGHQGGQNPNTISERYSKLMQYFDSIVLLNRYNFVQSSQETTSQLDRLQNVLQREDEFLQILNEAYETNITKLRYSPVVYGKSWSVTVGEGSESRTVSLDSLGDGIRTAVNVILKLIVGQPKIILIDEIEAHQHVKGLRYLCKSILSYVSKNNAQLLASTHSLEAIKMLLELSRESNISSAVHHFTLENGVLKSRTIPGLDAQVVIDMTGDVRYIDEYL